MKERRAVFGNPSVWDSVFKTYESAFLAIEDIKAIAPDLIVATRDGKQELVQVQSALTQLCSESMFDVLLLVGNSRGAGAMKIARGMFEISIISEYLEKNPNEIHDYLDYNKAEAWRHIKTVEIYSPGHVSPELIKQAEAEYDQIKQKFTKRQGKRAVPLDQQEPQADGRASWAVEPLRSGIQPRLRIVPHAFFGHHRA